MIYLFTIFESCKQPSDAEVIIQPALDKVHCWSSKWKLKLSPDKSTCVVFSISYKPGPDPLLFINGKFPSHLNPNSISSAFVPGSTNNNYENPT